MIRSLMNHYDNSPRKNPWKDTDSNTFLQSEEDMGFVPSELSLYLYQHRLHNANRGSGVLDPSAGGSSDDYFCVTQEEV